MDQSTLLADVQEQAREYFSAMMTARDALSLPGLMASDRIVLAALALYGPGHHQQIERLASDVCMQPQTVRNVLQRLERHGLVKVRHARTNRAGEYLLRGEDLRHAAREATLDAIKGSGAAQVDR